MDLRVAGRGLELLGEQRADLRLGLLAIEVDAPGGESRQAGFHQTGPALFVEQPAHDVVVTDLFRAGVVTDLVGDERLLVEGGATKIFVRDQLGDAVMTVVILILHEAPGTVVVEAGNAGVTAVDAFAIVADKRSEAKN